MTNTDSGRIILYNCYTVGDWKQITNEILLNARADTILVHFTLPQLSQIRRRTFIGPIACPFWFYRKSKKQFRRIRFIVSLNNPSEGESVGFKKN